MKNNIIIFIPFAFGGNPASESGPRCIFDTLKHNELVAFCDFLLIEQEFTESPSQFIDRVENNVADIWDKYEHIIVIGGNHLSVLPIYKYLYRSQYENCCDIHNIITLDAHRDYYPEKTINHATFFKQLNSLSNGTHYLLGTRDHNAHSEKHTTIIEQNVNLPEIEHIRNEGFIFLDIDVDVIDPEEFPWCGNALDGGLTIDCVTNTIKFARESNCKVIAVSEYIPNWDYDKKGLRAIINFIQLFLL